MFVEQFEIIQQSRRSVLCFLLSLVLGRTRIIEICISVTVSHRLQIMAVGRRRSGVWTAVRDDRQIRMECRSFRRVSIGDQIVAISLHGEVVPGAVADNRSRSRTALRQRWRLRLRRRVSCVAACPSRRPHTWSFSTWPATQTTPGNELINKI